MEAHRNVHGIAIEIVVLDDHLSKMDAGAKYDALGLRLLAVCVGHPLLQFDGSA
jgi:hypothetical protein